MSFYFSLLFFPFPPLSASIIPSFSFSVSTLNTKFPVEFQAFQKCLDFNDHRFEDCRKTERALLDCWNKANDLA